MPSLSFDLNWIQLPIDNPAPVSLLSKKYAEDSLMEVSQFLEGNNLLTQKRFVKLASQVDDNDVVHNPRSAAIVSQDTNSPEVKNWLRILKSLERQPGLDFRVTGVLKPDEIHSDSLKPDWMIWIGHAGFNTFNDLSCGVIYYNEPNADNSDNFIRIKSKGSNVYEVTGELSPLSIYEEEFLRELFDIIFKNEVSAEKLMKTDYRQITQIPGKGFISESATYIQKDFSYPFWIAFFIFLFLERYISLKRNQ
jgi:hypothetical protein